MREMGDALVSILAKIDGWFHVIHHSLAFLLSQDAASSFLHLKLSFYDVNAVNVANSPPFCMNEYVLLILVYMSSVCPRSLRV